MAERVRALYKRGKATAHQIAFVVETSTPDSDGIPNFQLQQAVAKTEITTLSDRQNITLELPIGVTSHGNYRESFIGTSPEHPVDLTQESESEGERNELFMIGFPEQSSQRRIQRPAFARHRESPSTTAIDLSGSEDYDVQPLVWADEDPDPFPAPIVAALLHEDFEAIVDSGSTRTIITGEARLLFRGPLQAHDQMVATVATGGQLQITGRGPVTPMCEVYYAPQLRRSVVSVYELCEQGHEVVMTAHGGLKRRPDGIPVSFTISPAGVWHVDMRQLFSDLSHVVAGADAHAEAHTHPPDEPHDPISSANIPITCALGHARPDCDDLELLHRRTGHTSHNILREAVRNGHVTGVQLDRKYFGTRSKIKRVLCDTCAKAKISRTAFPRSREQMADLRPGSRVADILIMLNTPSCEGFKYVLILVDYASKYVWIYPLVSRDEASVHSRSMLMI